MSVNGRYVATINGEPKIFVVIAQTTEPAVPAGKFRIWHDTTPAAERRWLILGTDGTVAGNQKVEIS